MIGKDRLEQASALCEKYGVWLCVDNTYEHFIYDPENQPHHTVFGKHVINVFSFSKARRSLLCLSLLILLLPPLPPLSLDQRVSE